MTNPAEPTKGKKGTCRLYMTMAPNNEEGHTFTLFWARNPHTFSGLQKFVEENVNAFTADEARTPPILICANVDVPESEITEETFSRIRGFQYRSIVAPVSAAIVN